MGCWLNGSTMKHLKCIELSRVIKWLEGFSGHGIYDADTCRRDWARHVGIERPQWPEHTYDETCQAIQDRGMNTELWGSQTAMYVWGHELSRCLAVEYAGFVSDKREIGMQYWDDIKALRNAEMVITL